MGTVVTVFGLASRYIGGSENYARELSLQLAAKGWRCVFCFLSQPPQEVLDYLNLPNVTVEVLEDSDAPRPSFATLKKLSRIFAVHKATILHLHLVGFVGLYPWLARLKSVKKVFFTHHMSHPEGYEPQRAPLWKRELVRTINWPMTTVICVSDYNCRCITGLDVLPAARFKRIYNGVDFGRVSQVKPSSGIAFRERFGIPAERVVVVQVSWIIGAKGVGDLLSAAGLLLRENQNVQFVLVGDGDEREGFMKQAEEAGIAGNVTWTGLIRDPFAEGVYDAADIVCQVSRWEEAFGQVISEAMACGKPVIGTRVGGIPEVIDDGVSGFLIARGDVEVLAQKIQQLASDKTLREKMGSDGRKIALEKFNLEKNVGQLVELYLSE